jgi:superfamily II DNA/RNA helicase
LKDIFQKIVYSKDILWGITRGYLSDIRGLQIGTDLSIADVSTRDGDFITKELATVVDTPKRNNLIVEAYKTHGENRQAIAFCVSVRHAKTLAALFNSYGISAAAAYGDMPKEEREAILQSFKRKQTKIITNCNLLTEGFDVADIGSVLMARPTKSRALYVQMVGRALRIAPNKKDCLLLDFVDIAGRHELCGGVSTLLDKKIVPENGQSLIEFLEEEQRERERSEIVAILKNKTQTIDFFSRADLAWETNGEMFMITISKKEKIICEPDRGKYQVYLTHGNKRKKLSEGGLTMEYAIGIAEDYAREHGIKEWIDKAARWRTAPPSDKQIAILKEKGIIYNPQITKGEAASILNKIFLPKYWIDVS